MRTLALLLILAVPSVASAIPVTFDFEYLPDSAGCSMPVPAYGVGTGLGVCDFDWVVQNDFAGVNMPYIDTEQGLTMEIGSGMGSAIAWNGQYVCGNSPWCGTFDAAFDQALDSITVDFSGIGGTDGRFNTEDYPDSTFAFVVIGYSDLERTLEVGRTVVADLPIPAYEGNMLDVPMSLTLSGVGHFRSVSIAALGINLDGEIANLGRIDALHAHVPEPGALALFAGALAGCWLVRCRRLRDARR